MKFLTVNKFIEELELLLEGKLDKLTVVMSGEDMDVDKYNNTQGTPCLVKVEGKDIDTKTYEYKAMRDLLEDDYILTLNLPRKFNKEYLACVIDVKSPLSVNKDGADGSIYYPRKFQRLNAKTMKQAKEQQKYINSQLGVGDELIEL